MLDKIQIATQTREVQNGLAVVVDFLRIESVQDEQASEVGLTLESSLWTHTRRSLLGLSWLPLLLDIPNLFCVLPSEVRCRHWRRWCECWRPCWPSSWLAPAGCTAPQWWVACSLWCLARWYPRLVCLFGLSQIKRRRFHNDMQIRDNKKQQSN